MISIGSLQVAFSWSIQQIKNSPRSRPLLAFCFVIYSASSLCLPGQKMASAASKPQSSGYNESKIGRKVGGWDGMEQGSDKAFVLAGIFYPGENAFGLPPVDFLLGQQQLPGKKKIKYIKILASLFSELQGFDIEEERAGNSCWVRDKSFFNKLPEYCSSH